MIFTNLLLDDYLNDFLSDLLNPTNRIQVPSLRVPNLLCTDELISTRNPESKIIEKKICLAQNHDNSTKKKMKPIYDKIKSRECSCQYKKKDVSMKPLFKYSSNKKENNYKYAQFKTTEVSPLRLNTCLACNRFSNMNRVYKEIQKSINCSEIPQHKETNNNNEKKLVFNQVFYSLNTEFNHRHYDTPGNIRASNKVFKMNKNEIKTGSKEKFNDVAYLPKRDTNQRKFSWCKLRNTEPCTFKNNDLFFKIERLSI